MPKNSKVGRCVRKLKKHYPKGSAIAICQKSTGRSYKTGKKVKTKKPAKKRAKGVGDTVAKCLHTVGVKKKPGCGCKKRQNWLNKEFPYQ